MPNSTMSARMRYRLDNFLGKGSSALFLALVVGFLGSLSGIAVVRFILHLVEPESGHTFDHQVWFIFLQLTDPGNMAQDNDTPVLFKTTAIMAGLTGVVIFSALIAFLTTALDQAIAHLKKGHSQVIESGHSLILGWGPRVAEILRELFEANESEDNPVVVILAEESKEEMDEFLRANVADTRNTRVVTRSGSTSALNTLERVNASEAKSAIVLATCSETAGTRQRLASDAKVIKSVLALVAHLEPDREYNIVAEVLEPRNRDVVKEIDPDRVSVVNAEEILAKVMVQTARTSGLSVVYSELLSFEGCELYFHNTDFGGIPFGKLQFHFHDGVPIGLRHADGTLVVRPDPHTPVNSDDDILIVADDDSTIHFEPAQVMVPHDLPLREARVEQKTERKLVLGWSHKAPIIISEYADYVLPGSRIDVMVKDPDDELRATIFRLNQVLDSLTITLLDRDPLVIEELAAVKPFEYNNVVILPQKPELDADAERIDSETLVVLLHLRRMARDLAEETGSRFETKLITEVLESANQDLVHQAGVDDFIISNRMVSMIFAQLSEEPDILRVYDDLFEEDGSEIYVKPAELYFEELPMTCRFGDLMALTQKRDGEVCIGYKSAALHHDAQQNYGVTLIPEKSAQLTINSGDGLVVVAEDDR